MGYTGEQDMVTRDWKRNPFKLSCYSVSSFHPGSKEPQPNAEGAAVPSLANISGFTQKLVEKLYNGMFSADPRHILLFITEHIMVVRILLMGEEAS
jgi:hypothetical protein